MFKRLKTFADKVGFFKKLFFSLEKPYYNTIALQELQSSQLRSLILHAYNNIPYYHELFNNTPLDFVQIKTIKDLPLIPVSEKLEMIKNISKLVDPRASLQKKGVLRTSGSTGVPFSIISDYQVELARRISFLRMEFLNGRRVSDKMMVITTPQNYLNRGFVFPWLQKLCFFRELYISTLSDPDKIISILRSYRPTVVLGYTGKMKEIAVLVEQKNIALNSIKTIFLTGEVLSSQDRRYIEKIFDVKVFDYYSSCECGLIAWECQRHEGYHIDCDNVIVEIIDEKGQIARQGDIVVTVLNNFTMPIIRFKLGDYGCFSDATCACGVRYPMLKLIAGRINDFIVLADGRKISPYEIMRTMDDIDSVLQYRIIQEAMDRVICLLDVRDGLFNSCAQRTQEVLRKIFPPCIKVDIQAGNCSLENYKRKIIINNLKEVTAQSA